MALTFTNKDSGADTTAGTTQVTGSVAFANDKLYLVSVAQRGSGNPTADSIAGGGLTWVEIAETPANQARGSIWRGLVTSGATTGALTITFSASCPNVNWSITEVTGMDASGTNGSGAIVQSDARAAGEVNNYAGVLATFGDATNNAAFAAICRKRSKCSRIPPSSLSDTCFRACSYPSIKMRMPRMYFSVTASLAMSPFCCILYFR